MLVLAALFSLMTSSAADHQPARRLVDPGGLAESRLRDLFLAVLGIGRSPARPTGWSPTGAGLAAVFGFLGMAAVVNTVGGLVVALLLVRRGAASTTAASRL